VNGTERSKYILKQAGNQIGENFWKMLLAEHGLDQNGVRLAAVFSLVRRDFLLAGQN
jgi:hypothetical protein